MMIDFEKINSRIDAEMTRVSTETHRVQNIRVAVIIAFVVMVIIMLAVMS